MAAIVSATSVLIIAPMIVMVKIIAVRKTTLLRLGYRSRVDNVLPVLKPKLAPLAPPRRLG